nr:hypothetical protein [Tanacetum cinerariifolium]
MARLKEMYVISSHTKKIFANMGRIGAEFSRVVTPLFETMMVQAAADIGDTPVETHQTPIVDQASISRPQKKQKPKRIQRKEVEIGSGRRVKSPLEKDRLSAQEDIIEDVSIDEPVSTAGEVVTIVADKSTKPNVVVQEQEVSTTIPVAATTVTTAVPTPRANGIVFHEQKQSHIPTISSSKDKGKAKMTDPKVPIKKKDQMRMDEEYARQLQAEEQEAARLGRAQQNEEVNI